MCLVVIMTLVLLKFRRQQRPSNVQENGIEQAEASGIDKEPGVKASVVQSELPEGDGADLSEYLGPEKGK